MATTFITAFKTSDEADVEMGFRKARDYRVVCIGPTDRIELHGDAPSSIVWDSGEETDWFLVIATRDKAAADLG